MSDFGTCEFNARTNLWIGTYLFYTATSPCENRIRGWLTNLELGEQGLLATECERNACSQFPHNNEKITIARDPNYTAKKRSVQLKPAAHDQEPQNEGVLLTKDEALEWLTKDQGGME